MRIGLTQRILYHKNRSYDALEHAWYDFLSEHTILPIANTVDQDFVKLADQLDALIITGGDDSRLRRTVELKLATQMMQSTKPVLGICHGAFLITEVLGGQVEECTGHLDTEHVIKYNDREITVNSYHNLAIKSCHKGANILCTDVDGNVEAWTDGVLSAIVWHPERMHDPFIPTEILKEIRL